MTTPTELKQVTLTATAAVQNGKIKRVHIDTCAIDGELPKAVGEVQLASRGDVIRAAFAPGDRVTIVDGRGIETSLGSPVARHWCSARVACIGQTGTVECIDRDGDVVVKGLARQFWSPAHVRKIAPAFAPGDRVTVVDGRKIDTSLGSQSARKWDGQRVSCIGQTGTVAMINGDGDVVVDGLGCRFWSPAHLRKVEITFKPGDVIICDGVQTGYPYWIPEMTPTIGLLGKVVRVDDVNLLVSFTNVKEFTYAKSWVRLATPSEIAAHALLVAALDTFKNTPTTPETVVRIVQHMVEMRKTAK